MVSDPKVLRKGFNTSPAVKEQTTPRLSVIIPTYNRGHLVTRAIDSALRAISPGDEIIVIDDGSADQTESVLRRYGSSIQYVKTENRGAGPARNLGIQIAKHDWIAFLDSDDEWMPDHLDLHRAFLLASNVLFSFSNFDACYDLAPERGLGRMKLVSWTKDFRSWDEILGKGVPYSRFAELTAGRKDFNVHIGSLYNLMLRASYVSVVTSVFRRDVAGEALRFPEDLPIFEDYDFCIRLAKLGNSAYLDCATAINHVHGDARVTGATDLTKAATHITILERNWGQDTEYLQKNRAAYEAILREQKKSWVKQLVIQGDTKRARKELRFMKKAPLSVRILSLFPGFVARFISKVYLNIRKIGG